MCCPRATDGAIMKPMSRPPAKTTKIFILACLSLTLAHSALAAEWVELQVAGTDVVYNDVVCTDANNCWIFGSNQGQGLVLHADPSIQPIEFTAVNLPNTPITPPTLRQAHFISPTRGWAVGEAECVLGYDSGTWTVLKHSGIEDLSAVFFLDALNGFVVCDSNPVENSMWTSGDGGENWGIPQVTTMFIDPRGIWFEDLTHGYMASLPGTGSETLHETNSGGLLWFPASTSPASSLDLHAIVETPDGRLWIPGTADRLFVAADSNSTFINTPTTLGSNWRDLAFAIHDPQLAWLVGEAGAIGFSDDGGSNWISQDVAATLEIRGVSAVDSTHAYAVAWDSTRGGVILNYGCTINSDCATTDACLISPVCNAGLCEYASVDCEDGDPCTDHSCDPILGCQQTYNTAACDDVDPCTYDDVCDGAGTCAGTAVSCTDDPDTCGVLRSCNGTSSCDEAFPGDLTSCDDLDPCTYDDACDGAGACLGTTIICQGDDGVCALNRACDGSATCFESYPDSSTACDDDELCTHTDVCDSLGGCIGTPMDCTDGSPPCGAQRSCDGSPNCVEIFPGAETGCDDSDLCSYDDACNGAGACAGSLIVCEDETTICGARRSCDGSSQCVETYPAAGSPCDDEDPCTIGEVCDGLGQCMGGQAYSCSDGDPCTEDLCDGQGGCSNPPSPAGTVCDICRVCSEQGECIQAESGAFCSGPDDCSPDGVCDAGGVCLVELSCGQAIRPSCPILADYGKEESQRTDCRLPNEAVRMRVSIMPTEPGSGGYLPVRLTLQNLHDLPLWDLAIRLELPNAQQGGFLPGSLRAHMGGEAVELAMRISSANDRLLLSLPEDRALAPGEAGTLLVDFLLQGDEDDFGRELAPLSLDVWAPCATEIEPGTSHSLGCHQGGASGGRQDLLFDVQGSEMLPLQSISTALPFKGQAGDYQADQELEESSWNGAGCSCANREPGWSLAFILALGAWWAWSRRKRSSE